MASPSPEPIRTESSRRIPLVGWAVAMFLCAACALPYLGGRFQYYPGDLVDARLCMFLLENGYKWIAGHFQHSLFDPPFFYPVRGALAYSDSFIGQLPFFAFWRVLGFTRETAFQIWFLLGFVLNFVCAAWVFARMRFHWAAAFLGACVFAFSEAALAQIGHSQLLYRFPIPLSWYFLDRFLDDFSSKRLLLMLTFLLWQFLCSLYEGYFLTLFLSGFVIASVVARPGVRSYLRRTKRSSAAAQGVLLVVFLILLGIVMRPYLHAAGDHQVAATRRAEVVTMLPRPVSYLISSPGNYETGWLFDRVDVPMKHEHALFVGVIPWACVIFLLFAPRKKKLHPAVLPSLAAMIGIMVLTLYVHGASLYFLLLHVPGVEGIRGVSRFIVVLLLPFSLAVVQVAQLWLDRFGGARYSRILWAAVLGAVLLLENRVAPFRSSKAEAQQRLQALSSELPAKLPHDAVLVYLHPGSEPERQPFELDAMLLAQSRNVFTANGYSARQPNGYRFLRTCDDLRRVLSDTSKQNDAFSMRDAASQTIIIGPAREAPCAHLNASITVQDRPLPPEAFRAKIQVQAPAEATVNSPFTAQVVVTNVSNTPWRVKGVDHDKYAILAACRWVEKDFRGRPPDFPNRFELPYDLASGDSASIAVTLNAPAVAGPYILGCDLVQELVHWFHDMGSSEGDAAVLVTATGQSIEGFLDEADSRVIGGWAWDMNHPNDPVRIELRDGTTVIGTVVADRFRQDLLEAGKGSGAHGFAFSPTGRLKSPGPHTIRAVVSDRGIELPGSPKILMAGQ